MQINDYRATIFKHFGVESTDGLKANLQFQRLIGNRRLNFRALKSWQLIYGLLFPPVPNQPQSVSKVKNDNDIKQTKEDMSSLIELKNSDNETVGVLLQYNKEHSQKLIAHFRDLSLNSKQNWHQGTLSSALVDQLGSASSLITAGLQVGQLFRVVGPPHLISGLAAGTHTMLQSTGGLLGSVKAVGSSGIVGNLRFAQAAMLPIMAPVIAYQILHAIVGTQQINQINQRLDKIQRVLERLHVRQEATVLGEIYYALNVLDDIIEERMQTGKFTEDMCIRLALVEKSVLSLLERDRILVEYFQHKAKNIKDSKKNKPRQNARYMADLLHEEGPQAIHDMHCLVGLIASDLKVEQARLLIAMQNNPADVGRRQERIRTKMESYSKAISDLPSVVELKDYAFECLEAMSWWSRHIFYRGTADKVKKINDLDLKDVEVQPEVLKPSLSGYVFWRDEQGTHVLAMSGEDLKLQVDLTVDKLLHVGRETQIRLPKTQEILQVRIEEEIEPKIWRGVTNTRGIDEEVIMRYRKK